MTLQQFARQVRDDFPDEKMCRVAIIPNLNDDGTETWHLEVELNADATLAGVYDTQIEVERGDTTVHSVEPRLIPGEADEADEVDGEPPPNPCAARAAYELAHVLGDSLLELKFMVFSDPAVWEGIHDDWECDECGLNNPALTPFCQGCHAAYH